MTDGSQYLPCQKCGNEVEYNFASNNGYVGMCGTCKELHYYCSIFGTIDIFKPTREKFNVNFKDFYYKSKKEKPEEIKN